MHGVGLVWEEQQYKAKDMISSSRDTAIANSQEAQPESRSGRALLLSSFDLLPTAAHGHM